MKKISVTIGIPAFNEEENIGFLLNDVLKQKNGNFLLKELIVVSDGSSDDTEKIVKKFSKKNVILHKNEKRSGLAFSQNFILEHTKSDILILLNADVRILDTNFISKMIKPIQEHSADLVSPSVIETEPTTFFEKVLFISTKIKNSAYESYCDGDNVYTCRGVARAFSKRFYTSFRFSTSIGEDAFSYYNCKVNGYKYFFVRDAKVIFKLPDNFSDHKKQSVRFYTSKELLKKEFGNRLISEGYRITPTILFKAIALNFLKEPLATTLYFAILTSVRVYSVFITGTDKWDRVSSSKTILKI